MASRAPTSLLLLIDRRNRLEGELQQLPVQPNDDAIRTTRRSALELAAQTSSTSYKTALPPTVLRGALCTGVMPSGFEPHVGALLDEAPMSLLIKLVEQIHAENARPREQVWSTMRDLANELKLTRDLGNAEGRYS